MSIWLPLNEVLTQQPEELIQALDRYRRVLNGSGYAFWEWGLEDDTYACGGNFWETLGYFSVEEAVNCVENVREYVHPDDFTMVYEVVRNHLRFNTPIDMVYRIKAKDGSYWWTQACASSTRDEKGRVTFLSGVNFDLSHLKDTEKALRLSEARHERILAASNDGIWEWSIDKNSEEGRFHTSHSCWKHLGYTEEEVDALPEDERLSIWRSHLHPHDLRLMQRALKRHFVLKTPFNVEYRMFGQEGEMFWMRSRGQAIFDGSGRAILMSGINIDVTQLKEAEERVRRAKNDAEKANNAKSRFLSSMSHELRTPLNAIMGFSQLSMNNEHLPVDQRQSSEQIYRAGEHLLDLINDVLDLALIEAGKLALSIESVSVQKMIVECFALVKTLADQKGITLHCADLDQVACVVHADVMRLKQCLLNLLSNAVKYNVDGGHVSVAIGSSVSSKRCYIIIEDTGSGITLEKQKELFQPFNRLGAESSSVEGSGIGLVITKELVEQMSGQLSYCGKAQGGAGFKIELPMSHEKVAASANPSLQPATDTVVLHAFSGIKTVLYIEDNASNIRLMEEMFAGYSQIELACFNDPLVGLYQSRLLKPDIILLDINLPGMRGLDLVGILKKDPSTRHIPVIALSANAMSSDVVKGKAAGFDEYLSKPVSLLKITATLNQFLSITAAA